MKLTNNQLTNFINRIKLKKDNMPVYRNQVNNLQEDLEKHIAEDTSTGIKVTKATIAGSWKKGTILRPTGIIRLILTLCYMWKEMKTCRMI
jgi:hypothetical protein